MVEQTVIYILKLKDTPMFKIGQSRRLENRIIKLQRLWGDFDFENSYIITSQHEDYSALESSLHNVFIQYRKWDLERKDGYCEFFDIEALPIVLEYLNDFTKVRQDIEIYSLRNIEIENKEVSDKMGRPKKAVKHNNKISTYVNEEDFSVLQELADSKFGGSISFCLREIIQEKLIDLQS